MSDITQHLCFSGGAAGSDHAWGIMAADRGHSVIHFTFQGHNVAVDDGCHKLSRIELDEADAYVAKAAVSMKRKWPSQKQIVNDLLRRNYFQIRYTERVYAIANYQPNDTSVLKVSGGTAWACQMYVDRWYSTRDIVECELYLYDMLTNKWMQWWETWKVIDKPPVPHGRYTGIGSRDITDDGVRAIFEAYG